MAPFLACLAMPALAQIDAKEMQRFRTVTYLGEPFPPRLDEDVEALYREASADPDQTRSVRFKPYWWFKEDDQLAQTEWTWRESPFPRRSPCSHRAADREDETQGSTSPSSAWATWPLTTRP